MLFFFNYFGIVIFVNTTLDKYQFQSQVRLFQVNVVLPIRLNLRLGAVLIELGSWIDVVFV